jgi:hypothetical protein
MVDRHILLPSTFEPVDINDFFDTKLSGPYTIIYIEHTKKEDSGSTTQVNSLLFSKSLSLIDGDDNIHSVAFNSEEDKQNWKRMIMERVQELPGLSVNPDRDLLRNDVTVFLPTEEVPLEDMVNIMSYVTIDDSRKFIEKEGLRKIVVFDYKVETIPQEDSAFNPRRLDFGDMSDDDSSSNPGEYSSEYSNDDEESDEESENQSESGAETEGEGENYSLYPFINAPNYTNIDYVGSNIPAYVRILYNEFSTDTFFNSRENILDNFTSFKFIMKNLILLRSIIDNLEYIDDADDVDEIIDLVSEAEQDIVDIGNNESSEEQQENLMDLILENLIIRIGYDTEANRYMRPSANPVMTGGGNKLSRFTLDGRKYLYNNLNGSIYNLGKSGRTYLGYVKNNRFIAN